MKVRYLAILLIAVFAVSLFGASTAMAEPRAGDWVADTALFLEIARSIGDRVLVMRLWDSNLVMALLR